MMMQKAPSQLIPNTMATPSEARFCAVHDIHRVADSTVISGSVWVSLHLEASVRRIMSITCSPVHLGTSSGSVLALRVSPICRKKDRDRGSRRLVAHAFI